MGLSSGDDGLMMEVEYQVEPPAQGREIVRMYRDMKYGDYVRITKVWDDGNKEVYEGFLTSYTSDASWNDLTITIGVGHTEVEIFSQTSYDDEFLSNDGSSAVFRSYTTFPRYRCSVELLEEGDTK